VTRTTGGAPAGTGTVLVACFGNVLRGDDGFGTAVAAVLGSPPLPAGVEVMDVGIGGIHLVQELMRSPVDLLVIVDAVDLGLDAGTVVVQRPEVADVTLLPDAERRDQLADMHLATPERALRLARGLGALPPSTLLVGVQTTDTERVGEGLSANTATAVVAAAAEVRRIVAGLAPRSGR
jgi:hydrogenase maturation protease